MGHLIGHGRYARETYPEAGGGGGSGASIVPLSRQRFIDGGTTQPGLTGSAAEPFKTIAQFIAARGNASVADATANFVGWMMPALNGYAGGVAFPPYVSTELRADSFSTVPGSGTVITGDVVWDNVAGAHAGTAPTVIMHNLGITGSFTVHDTVDSPTSIVIFGGDEIGENSAQIPGGFDSHETVKLGQVAFTNALIGTAIFAGSTVDSAVVGLDSSEFDGNAIVARSLAARNSRITAETIVISDTGTAGFINCTFGLGSPPVLSAIGGATFDGPSWRSFMEAGGTVPSGFALVVGGYQAGAISVGVGGGSGTFDLSLNGVGADAAFGNHFSFTGLGADVTAHLLAGSGGELPGDTILITKPGTDAHTVTVTNNAAGTIAMIPSGSRGFVLAQFNGSDWVFAEGGSLAA